jgi:Ran GTPase-activating protein (RanGAP) involved in mRNA processing and transport
MKSVDPKNLARAINKLEVVNMYDCLLTNQQAELMFEQMSKATNLKKLRLSYNNLSSIDPAILGTQVSQLESMHMEEVELTPPQVETLFMSLNICSVLTDLDISSNILATVQPRTLARALNRIAEVNVTNCALTAEQVETLFESINEATCMKDLSIALNNLSFIGGDSLARGVNLLRTVNMSCTNLTPLQAETVMSLADKGTRLKGVCFDTDLIEQINPQIMEAAVARMNAIQRV